MAPISDPIGNGLVASFARPGANVTGVTLYSNELAGKRLELLRQIAPKITRVAVLVQRDHPPTATFVIETEAAARTLGCQLHVLPVRAEPADIVKAFASMIKERDGGVIVQQTGSLNAHMRQMADLAMRHRLPTVHASQLFAETAGSWPMDPAYLALGYRAATYVDKILKGAKPADLPVEQPARPDDPAVGAGPRRRNHPMMTRRTFLCGLTLGTLSATLAAGAQQFLGAKLVGEFELGDSVHAFDNPTDCVDRTEYSVHPLT
jgi:ABC-type uncharacterized transport system substrate-binding protein